MYTATQIMLQDSFELKCLPAVFGKPHLATWCEVFKNHVDYELSSVRVSSDAMSVGMSVM